MTHHDDMDQIPKFATVGQRLAWWMVKRNRKQTELARAVGMVQSALSQILRGQSKRPAADNMLSLARELQIEPEYLVWGEGPPEAASFSQLSGLEAQLVMLFRGLPDDAKRHALLIDVNDFYSRHRAKTGPTVNQVPQPGAAARKPAVAASTEQATSRKTEKT